MNRAKTRYMPSSPGNGRSTVAYDAVVRRVLVGILIQALGITVIAGCASNASPKPPASISDASVPAAAPESPTAAQIEHALRIRTLLGLRADRPFIQALFFDLPAVERGFASAYSIPLTAAELERLERQEREADAAIPVVERYAATVPDAWAGLYIDTITREVVAQFKRPIESHEKALQPLVAANAPLRVVGVEWPLVELEHFREAVGTDLDWLAEVNTRVQGLGVDLVGNRVELEVRSTRPDISDVIRAHFDGSPMLSILVETKAPWTGGHGTLVVVAEDEDGSPVENHECSLVAVDRAAWGDDRRATGDDGRCTFLNVGAMRFRVLLTRESDGVLVAGDTTTVLAGETVTMRMVIHAKP